MIIDAHTHLGRLGKASNYYGSTLASTLGDFMINLMDKNGIDKIVTFPMGHILTLNAEANWIVAEEAKRYPDRELFPLFSYPHFGEDTVKEFEQGVKELGFKGLKLHPARESFTVNDEMVFPLIEKAIHLKVPMLIHSHTRNQSQPTLIGDLVDHYPDATIIMAHLGCTQYKDAMFVLRHSNHKLGHTVLARR